MALNGKSKETGVIYSAGDIGITQATLELETCLILVGDTQLLNMSANQIEKWLNCPNVPITMHYDAYCKQYARSQNNNAQLIGEKYRCVFKSQATNTKHTEVELQLLRHESYKKIVRLRIDGVFHATNPMILCLFKAVVLSCPALIKYMLTASNQCFLEPD